MSKKIKVLLAVVIAAVVLTVGGGVVVMADDGEQTTTSTTTTAQSNPLFAKVAAILGNVTEAQLTEAFKQAREEVADEATATWLTKAVEAGTITAEEKTTIENWLATKPDGTDKDAMKAWLEARPSVVKRGFIDSLLKAPCRIKQVMPEITSDTVMQKVATILGIDEATLKAAFQQAGVQLKSENFTKALDKAVENGKLTQEEADQIEAWWAERPAAVDKVMPGAGIGGLGQGKRGEMRGGMRGGMMRFQQRLPGVKAQ
ncbi:MAG: hypothetical protein PHY28_08175 [Dehalococcoidales bacterium]|nr:hypothetical protein [Dehalococcoidales bacterium]